MRWEKQFQREKELEIPLNWRHFVRVMNNSFDGSLVMRNVHIIIRILNKNEVANDGRWQRCAKFLISFTDNFRRRNTAFCAFVRKLLNSGVFIFFCSLAHRDGSYQFVVLLFFWMSGHSHLCPTKTHRMEYMNILCIPIITNIIYVWSFRIYSD